MTTKTLIEVEHDSAYDFEKNFDGNLRGFFWRIIAPAQAVPDEAAPSDACPSLSSGEASAWASGFNTCREAWLSAPSPAAVGGDLTIEDYKAVIADHARLVRELDVLLNGDCAAEQASLVDIIAQLSKPAPTPAGVPDDCTQDSRGIRTVGPHGGLNGSLPNPTDTDLNDPLFNAIWDVTKTWDVNAPEYYVGYCGMNGSHVMGILNAIREALTSPTPDEYEEVGEQYLVRVRGEDILCTGYVKGYGELLSTRKIYAKREKGHE